ncbi:MAG: VCBS repeat-containing protein [Planctomycetes bacterium]|nr:VCBS repeat-containing protein [Planctomycetota bacterium]
MESKWRKHLAAIGITLGVIVGCTSVFQQINEQADQGTGGGSAGGAGGFSTVESEFTDAPLSPGGTGGVVDTPDGQPAGEETRSFFTAYQIDPASEDSAGPKFVVSGDVDQDGLLDLVSAWNQSQPVQLHLQRRDAAGNVSFRTVTLAGTTPVAVVAGVQLGQINDDGFLDVVVLSKATGFVTLCPPKNPSDPPTEISRTDGEIIVYFSPGNPGLIPDGDSWTEMILVNPFVADRWIHDQFPGIEFKEFEEAKTKPEWNGFTSLAVGNVDGVPGDDIVVALNPGECETLGQKPPTNTVDLWINPGPGASEDSTLWGVPAAGLSRGVPISLIGDAPQVKDVALNDIDGDGDLDVLATYTNSISLNVRWVRNPLVPHTPGGPSGYGEVIAGFVPGVDVCSGGANDGAACPNGDADCAGIPDGTCTPAGVCTGGQFDGQACATGDDCLGIPDGTCTVNTWWYFASGWQERPVGQVDSGADVMKVGDIDGDGFDDVLIRSIDGRIVQWFRRPNALSIQPEFPPSDPTPDRFNFPWPVFTLTEILAQEPEAIAIGDVTGDGNVEVIVAGEGAVAWYEGMSAPTVYDPWAPNTIIQDSADAAQTSASTAPPATSTTTPTPGTGVGVTEVDTSTHINALLVVDLDADGKNDIVGTLDRRSGTGLSDDRLVWYRNTRTDD